MHISVIVPFHDSEEFIEDCIRALLSQRYPRDCFEVIMVDNNSTDRSAAIVRQYPQIRLLSESKPGAYAARNRGVLESKGAIFAFTDSDCAPTTDWLQKIWEAMDSPEVSLVLGRQRFARESVGLSILADYEAARAAHIFSGIRKEIYFGYTNNLAVRRTVFDTVGPFEEWLRGADTIFVHRVIEAYSCAAVCYSPGMFLRHLEVTNARIWFRKMHIYGQSSRRYGRRVQTRPLSGRDRLQVLRATIRANGYSSGRSLLLIVLLSIGLVSFQLGRWRPDGSSSQPRLS